MRCSAWSRLICLEGRLLCWLLIRWGLIVVKSVISVPSIRIKVFVGCGVWRRSFVVFVAVIDKDIGMPVRGATSRIHLLFVHIAGRRVCAVCGCSVSSLSPIVLRSTYIFRRRTRRVWHECGVATVAGRRCRVVLLRVHVWWYSRCGAETWRRMAGSSCVRRLHLRAARARCAAAVCGVSRMVLWWRAIESRIRWMRAGVLLCVSGRHDGCQMVDDTSE